MPLAQSYGQARTQVERQSDALDRQTRTAGTDFPTALALSDII